MKTDTEKELRTLYLRFEKDMREIGPGVLVRAVTRKYDKTVMLTFDGNKLLIRDESYTHMHTIADAPIELLCAACTEIENLFNELLETVRDNAEYLKRREKMLSDSLRVALDTETWIVELKSKMK